MTSNPRYSAFALKAAVVAITIGLGACNTAGAGDSAGPAGPGDLSLMHEVIRQIERSYVAPVDGRQLEQDALKGMLTRLDPHSDFMDEQQYRQLIGATRGEFGGIGIELTLQGAVPQVIAPIEGTPAAAAGIEPGDRIIRVDGQPTAGMDGEEIVKRLRGTAGTRVVLTIARAERPAFDVSLTRAVVHVVSVKSQLEPGNIGYVRISSFAENTPADLTEAISRLRAKAHGRLAGFVLDLRNDPGGLLDAAVTVAGDFIDGGTVVTTRGRDKSDDHVYQAPAAGDELQGAPMVVLINSASASAAEIVAGALQDHHRATLIGTRSFGKGSVQSIIPLDGRGALRLTTALYYTPSGRSIQGSGIAPDVVVPLPKDEQVANSVINYERDLYGALKNSGSLDGARSSPEEATQSAAEAENIDRPINPTVIGTKKDTQLSAALNYLETGAQKGGSTRG